MSMRHLLTDCRRMCLTDVRGCVRVDILLLDVFVCLVSVRVQSEEHTENEMSHHDICGWC